MKYIYIYPNVEQKEYIKKIKNKNIVIIDKNNPFCLNFDEIKENYNEYEIMCCSEEALYYFYAFLNFEKNSKISDSCLELYDKYKSYNIFKEKEILCTYKSKKNIGYPFIVKPNFGFASIGVKYIENDDQLQYYLNSFDFCINNSEIQKLNNIYFKGMPIYPIYESVIDNGYFFSVPFVFDKEKKEVVIFPVQGQEKVSTPDSDFVWKKFIYDEASINNSIYEKIKEFIYDISIKFDLGTSVNMAEIIYDINTDQVKLLEFSPRVPGGRLSKLIYYGSGINLNELSIDLFNNENYSINKKYSPMVLDICFELDCENDNRLMSEKVYSSIFKKEIKYEIYNYEYPTIGLVPGRFAPPHKGHFFVLKKASKEMDKVIIMIFDTEDINVPLQIRADWIREKFPLATVIEAHNCPDGKKYAYELGQKYANVQNNYIKKMLGNNKITHVYHSNIDGDCLSRFLNAKDVKVDCNRKRFPISGTMIRSDLNKYKRYLDKFVLDEYRKYYDKDN